MSICAFQHCESAPLSGLAGKRACPPGSSGARYLRENSSALCSMLNRRRRKGSRFRISALPIGMLTTSAAQRMASQTKTVYLLRFPYRHRGTAGCARGAWFHVLRVHACRTPQCMVVGRVVQDGWVSTQVEPLNQLKAHMRLRWRRTPASP